MSDWSKRHPLEPTVIAHQAGAAIAAGRVTRQEAERAVGFVLLAQATPSIVQQLSESTYVRTLRILRRIGVDVDQVRELAPRPRAVWG